MSTRSHNLLPLHAAFRKWLLKWTSIVEIQQHYLLASVLSDQSNVLDLGANVGGFSIETIARFGCHVIAIEPEKLNFEAISAHPRLRKFRVAVGGTRGTAGIRISLDRTGHRLDCSSNVTTVSEQLVETHTFPSLLSLASLKQVDLMKIDVEGCEWDLLDTISDEQLRSIGQLTVEFHDFLPEYRENNRTWKNYQRLIRLGFHCIEDPYFHSYNVLFVNRRLKLSRLSDRIFVPLNSHLLRLVWKLQRLQRHLFQPS